MAEIKLFAADEQIKTWELIPITAALKHAGGRMKFIFVLAVRVHGTRIDLQHMCFLCAFTWVANSTGPDSDYGLFDATVVGTTEELKV